MRLATCLAGLALAGSALACRPSPSVPPDRQALVTAHLQGDYSEVLHWCPRMLYETTIDRQVTDWCVYGLPAAMRLSLDSAAANEFVHNMCVDPPSGMTKGSDDFRAYYVREVARWVALPLRAQKLERNLDAAVDASLTDFSAACEIDPATAREGLETTIASGRGAERSR